MCMFSDMTEDRKSIQGESKGNLKRWAMFHLCGVPLVSLSLWPVALVSSMAQRHADLSEFKT